MSTKMETMIARVREHAAIHRGQPLWDMLADWSDDEIAESIGDASSTPWAIAAVGWDLAVLDGQRKERW